jgi:hypothetical protein
MKKHLWIGLVLLLDACASEDFAPADDEAVSETPVAEQQNDLRPPPVTTGGCPVGQHLYCPPVTHCPPGTPPWDVEDKCTLMPQPPGQENCICVPD